MKNQSFTTVIVFCLLLFGFTAASVRKPSAEFSETENRFLAQRPTVRAESVINGSFQSDYEEYLNDQFPFRNGWICLKTSAERLLLKRESKDIYFAEDGYLIEKHTGSFETDTARRNIAALAEFVQHYAEQFEEPHLSVLVIPNAVDILQDKLPPFASPGGGNDYLKELAKTLPENVWFDAGRILQAHAEEALYYRTDHHWKTLAAFYVYRAWADRQGYTPPKLTDYEICTVTDSFEGTVQAKLGISTREDTIELFLPKTETSYTVYNSVLKETKDSLYDCSALDSRDKYAVFFGGNQPFLRICTESGSGRRILVIKDSYANCFLPFMLEEFQEIDVVDLRYTSQRLSELIAENKYTDLLLLYNASGFAEDMSITKLTN